MTTELPRELHENTPAQSVPTRTPVERVETPEKKDDTFDRLITLGENALPLLHRFMDAYTQRRQELTALPPVNPLNPENNPLVKSEIITSEGLVSVGNQTPIQTPTPTPTPTPTAEQPDFDGMFEDAIAYLEQHKDATIGEFLDDLKGNKTLLIAIVKDRLGYGE